MSTFKVGVFFTVLNLLAIGESVKESCPQETEFKCGLRPVEHPQQANEKYVGPAYPGQWPWYGIVYHRKPNRVVEYACGGTLISRRHVLTSSECVKSENGTILNSGDVLFRIGTHKQNVVNVGYAQHRQVIKMHRADDNKIVILELSNIVKFNKYVQPACFMPIPSTKRHRTIIVIGWGLPEGNDCVGNYKVSEGVIHDSDDKTKMNCPNHYGLFNRSSVCGKDRGGVIHRRQDYLHLNVTQFVYAIIDCNYVESCESQGGYVGITILLDYLPWIATITNLDYLQIVRKGQKYDPSKQYPNLLPRRHCGNVLIGNITDGPNAQLYEYPWMAMIFCRHFRAGYIYHLCTGTLISHRLFVRLGDYDKRQNPDCTGSDQMDCAPPFKDYDVEYTIEHPDFYESHNPMINDIALIRTKKTVLYEDHIQPVCLPVISDLRQNEFKQYITTYWNHPRWNHANLDELQTKKESLVNVTECLSQATISEEKINFSAIKCSNKNDYGYPGTPLGNIVDYNGNRFIQFALLSIHRNGSFFYTYIPYYMDWIVANMEE